jgi:coenzyme Q-binding protein COQ10
LHRTAVTRVLPYPPEQLFELVGDVERYPDFVPWVSAMRVWNRATPEPGITTLDAEAGVRFAFLREKFATRVRRDANARTIEVGLLYGPFRHLRNTWTFAPDPAGTRIDFLIEYAFKSRLLDTLLAMNFHTAADKLISCFEARAKALYDQPSGAQGARG